MGINLFHAQIYGKRFFSLVAMVDREKGTVVFIILI